MNQSTVIAFFLLIGFVVYITIKGELPAYAAILGFGSQASTSPLVAGSLIDKSNVEKSTASIASGIY